MHLSISNKILAWYKKYQRDLPWRRYSSKKDRHYKVLLSEFMLQQTQVKTVIPYFNIFYKNINSIEKLAKTSQLKVNKLWQGLGYYRRAKFLLETSKIVVNDFKGKLPTRYEDLIKLPGIGDYTAKAILSIALDQSTIGIDGNVRRVISRVFNVYCKNKISENVNKLLVKENSCLLMQGIMEIGALICKPQNPLCRDCCLHQKCKFYLTGEKLIQASRKPKKIKKLIACIFIKNKKILLSDKNNFGPLRGFLNVPLVERTKNNFKLVLKEKFKQNVKYSNLGYLNISISNIETKILCIKIKDIKKVDNPFIFLSSNQLQKKFISSFLKKILKKAEFTI